MPRPITTFFQADHARLDALLRRAVGAEGAIDAEAYAAFRRGLLKHIAWEEKLLFPAVRGRGGRAAEDARRLHVDHGALALLLVPSPTRALVEEIRSILEPHNRLEEGPGGVYAVGDALPEEERERLLARARAYPEVKVAPHFDGERACRTAREALAIAAREHGGREG